MHISIHHINIHVFSLGLFDNKFNFSDFSMVIYINATDV
jgi:hypothetical protein